MLFSPRLTTWSRFWGVFWVDVSTRPSAEENFSEIAEALGCAKTVEAVRKTLSNLPPTSRWLLILDNADDPNRDYEAYFPSGNRGAILMTSRNPHCGFLATTSGHEGLHGLEQPECVQLLQQTARLSEVSGDSEDYGFAVTLVQHLGHHTLAILQAGSYIATTHCSISEYLDFLHTNRQRLLEKSRGQGQSRYDTVYATFGASMEFLESKETGSSEETRRDALQLLEVLSTFHYTSVPLDVLMDAWEGAKMAQNAPQEFEMYSEQLTAWHVSRVPYLISPETNDVKLRITDAVARLESLALVRTDRPGRIWRSVSMHPLVHGWAGDRQSQQERKDALRMTECICALSDFAVLSWRPYHHQFAPHLRRLVELDVELVDDAAHCRSVLQVCVRIASIFNRMDLDRDLYNFTGRVFQRLDLDVQEPTVELSGLYRVFAGATAREGSRPVQAIRAFEAIARLDWGTLRKDDPNRLENMLELGNAYRNNGQIGEAVALSRKVVKEIQWRRAEDHYLLKAQHSLALALLEDGQDKEAIMLLEKVLMIRQRLLPEDDPDRLVSQQVLAVAYLKNGQIAEATRRLEQLALIYAEVVGEKHLETALTQGWLADAYLAAGRISKAIELYEQVLNTRTLFLDETHPVVLGSQHGLAITYLEAGRIQEATNILEIVVRVQKLTLDDTDPSRLVSQQELARAYLIAGRVSEAVGILERVVDISKSTLEEQDPQLLASQHELGHAYLQAGRVVEAIAILEQVVGIRKSILKDKDPRLLNAQHELVYAYVLAGRVIEAIGILERVVGIRKSIAEDKDPRLLDAQMALGQAYLQVERAVEAIEMLEQVAKVTSLRYDPDHPGRVELQESLRQAYAIRDASCSSSESIVESRSVTTDPILEPVEASEQGGTDDVPTVEAEGQRLETSRDSLERSFPSSLVLRVLAILVFLISYLLVYLLST